MTKAERTRERLFKTQWLPAVTGKPAGHWATLNASLLRELYPLVWMFGGKGEVLKRQLAALQVQIDGMLALKGETREALLSEFTSLAEELDNWIFDRGNSLGSTSDTRIIHVFYYPQEITGEDPMLFQFGIQMDTLLNVGRLPWDDHAFNQTVLQFISLSLNLRRLRRSDRLIDVLDMYLGFCERWALPVE